MAKPGLHRGHALIIGVAAYQRIAKLPGVVLDDARALAAVLTSRERGGYDPGDVVQLLDDQATRDGILAALSTLGARAGPLDTVFIYFSGHGALLGPGQDSSLLPVDCDPAAPLETSISTADLSAALQAIRASRLVVVLDACHAAGATTLETGGGGHPLRLGFSEGSLDHLSAGAGRVLLASSRSSETSLILPGARNSAFTEALLTGLGGAADLREEGVIKVFDLFEFVAARVLQLTGDRQHPILKASMVEQNFVLALNTGATARPVPSSPASAIVVRSDRDIISTLLRQLYPLGPQDQDLWVRAGGDLAVLRLGGSGKAMWFAALGLLDLGGGGPEISAARLLAVVREDFPQNDALKAQNAASQGNEQP